MNYPPEMEQDCIKICDALNSIEGIETNGSCSGDGRWLPWALYFSATYEGLADLVRTMVDNDLFQEWNLYVYPDKALGFTYILDTKAKFGDAAKEQANRLADLITTKKQKDGSRDSSTSLAIT